MKYVIVTTDREIIPYVGLRNFVPLTENRAKLAQDLTEGDQYTDGKIVESVRTTNA